MNKLAILVGGGPAPGINSVIGAATIRACLGASTSSASATGSSGSCRGTSTTSMPLAIDVVSRIHFRGGSHLGISRANPTKDPSSWRTTLDSLLRWACRS